jgi:hypothetical protein
MTTRTLSSIPPSTMPRSAVAASPSPRPRRRVYLAGKMHGSGNWRLPLVPQLGVSPFGQPIDCGHFIFLGRTSFRSAARATSGSDGTRASGSTTQVHRGPRQ